MSHGDQAGIDARILRYYGEDFNEDARLTTRSPQGPLEFQRTQDIIRSHVRGGRVLDVGGGTGQHARALQQDGFAVELIDPVPQHVEIAAKFGLSSRVGDARALPFETDTFDATMMLGPLYHLRSREDRQVALTEAVRVTRPGGIVLAAALSRFVAFGAVSLGQLPPDPYPEAWTDLLATGEVPAGLRFPAGHFHTAEELDIEMAEAGLEGVEVVGLEGPGGLLLEVIGDADTSVSSAALALARAASSVAGIRDLSAHLLGIGCVSNRE